MKQSNISSNKAMGELCSGGHCGHLSSEKLRPTSCNTYRPRHGRVNLNFSRIIFDFRQRVVLDGRRRIVWFLLWFVGFSEK